MSVTHFGIAKFCNGKRFIASLAMLLSSALCAATRVCIWRFIFYSTTQLKLLGLGEMYHSRSAIWVSNFDFFPLHLLSSLSSLISDFFRLPSSPSSLLVTLTWLPQRRHSRSLTRVVRTWLNWACLTQIHWLMALLFRWVTQCLCYMCYYVLFGLYAFAYELLTFGCAIVGLCNTCASKRHHVWWCNLHG